MILSDKSTVCKYCSATFALTSSEKEGCASSATRRLPRGSASARRSSKSGSAAKKRYRPASWRSCRRFLEAAAWTICLRENAAAIRKKKTLFCKGVFFCCGSILFHCLTLSLYSITEFSITASHPKAMAAWTIADTSLGKHFPPNPLFSANTVVEPLPTRSSNSQPSRTLCQSTSKSESC